MGEQNTPGAVTPQAPGSGTPPAPQPPANSDPAEELRRENDQLKKQLADKDKHITDLSSEKSTLEARLTQTQRPPNQKLDDDLQKETARIMETAQVDPQKAGEELAQLIKNSTSKAQQAILQNIEPIINQQSYINEVKKNNADLIELGLEISISHRAQQLLQTGKSFKDAVDAAVSEARAKVDKLKSNTPPAPPTPPPPGGVGEKGSNNEPPPTPPPREETPEDEIAAERARKRKMGL